MELRTAKRRLTTATGLEGDFSSNTGVATYARTLLDPRNSHAEVPDLTTQPCIGTNLNITSNIVVSAANIGGNGDGMILVLPKRDHLYVASVFRTNDPAYEEIVDIAQGAPLLTPLKLSYSEAINAAASAMLQPGSQGAFLSEAGVIAIREAALKTNRLIVKQIFKKSRPLSDSYTYARLSSAWIALQSATTSTTNAALSGTLTSVAFNSLDDLSTFEDSELADVGTTHKDFILQVPAYHGTIYTPGPELIKPFTTPSDGDFRVPDINEGSSLIFARSINGSIHYDQGNPAIRVDLPDLRNNFGQLVNFKAFVNLNVPGASNFTGNIWFVFPALAYFEGNMRIILIKFYRNFQINQANDGQTFDFQIDLSDKNGDGFYGSSTANVSYSAFGQATNNVVRGVNATLLPMFFVGRSNLGGGPDGPANITGSFRIEFPEYANSAATGPGALLKWRALGVGQSLQLFGFANYEAVPAQSLAKDIKAGGLYRRHRDTSELTLAEALFNHPESPCKRIWSGHEYNLFIEGVLPNITQKSVAIQYASGWFGNFMKGAAKVGAALAPAIGGVLGGPMGAQIGGMVGGVLDSLSSSGLPRYSSAGLPRGNAYATGRSDNKCYAKGQFYSPMSYECTVSEVATQPAEQQQVKIADLTPKGGSKLIEFTARAAFGDPTARAPVGGARFPVVSADGVGSIQELIISPFPVQRSDGSANQFREVKCIETHNRGATRYESTVYVDDNLGAETAAYCAKIMCYYGRSGHYLSLIGKDAAISGPSLGLAVVSACMGLPPIAVLTGEVQLREYPQPPLITEILDYSVKATVCSSANEIMIAPLGNLPVDNDSHVPVVDIAGGYMEGVFVEVIGITATMELYEALMYVIGSIYMTTVTESMVDGKKVKMSVFTAPNLGNTKGAQVAAKEISAEELATLRRMVGDMGDSSRSMVAPVKVLSPKVLDKWTATLKKSWDLEKGGIVPWSMEDQMASFDKIFASYWMDAVSLSLKGTGFANYANLKSFTDAELGTLKKEDRIALAKVYERAIPNPKGLNTFQANMVSLMNKWYATNAANINTSHQGRFLAKEKPQVFKRPMARTRENVSKFARVSTEQSAVPEQEEEVFEDVSADMAEPIMETEPAQPSVDVVERPTTTRIPRGGGASFRMGTRQSPYAKKN